MTKDRILQTWKEYMQFFGVEDPRTAQKRLEVLGFKIPKVGAPMIRLARLQERIDGGAKIEMEPIMGGEENRQKYIYFVKAENGFIKIGITRDVLRRFFNLQTSSPLSLTLVASMPGTEEEEAQLHSRFEKHKVKGEWYSPATELLDYISSIIKTPRN